MRIAFVTTEFITEDTYTGGLANYLFRICSYLKKHGHEPVVIIVSKSDEVFTFEGIEVHRVKTASKFISICNAILLFQFNNFICAMWTSWKLKLVVLREHKKIPLDIVQYASSGAIGFFRVKGIPSIIRINSHAPLNRRAYGDDNDSPDIKLFDKISLEALKRADGLYGPSKTIASLVEQIIGKKVHVIESPIYIELKKLDSKPYEDLLKGKKYLLFFGTLGLLKGVLTIAEMIDRFLEKYKDFLFVFVGNDIGYQGRPAMDYVWSQAGSNRGKVFYLGKMEHKFLYPIIKNAYAVILPSRVDNFPNTCLEAMLFGKIVIGTRRTSFEELIIDKENGFLCEPDNSEDLYNTIDYVMNLDSKSCKSIANKAYEKSQEFSPALIYDKLIKYYKGVMKHHKQ